MGTTRSTDEPRQVQHERAHEPGRGRHATAPWQIPWAGWKDILWRTYQQINEDRVLAVAAGVVFYGLLAIFPAITAMVSLYGLFAKASTINEHLSLVAGFLPGGAVEIVQEQRTHPVKATGEADVRTLMGSRRTHVQVSWCTIRGSGSCSDLRRRAPIPRQEIADPPVGVVG